MWSEVKKLSREFLSQSQIALKPRHQPGYRQGLEVKLVNTTGGEWIAQRIVGPISCADENKMLYTLCLNEQADAPGVL